ncbi:type II toxin-antitoxin system VapC family toxin [bacterium]|nr:type II toxin-antitoxin system VapC family toxin [bacterium]
MMYILDTNIIIYFFKGSGAVAKNLLSISPMDIGVTTITLFELEVGIAKSHNPSKRRDQLGHLLSNINLFPLGKKEAETAASIRAHLEMKGQMIGLYDVLIAGITLANNAVLVSHNLREFNRIDGLYTEDWY